MKQRREEQSRLCRLALAVHRLTCSYYNNSPELLEEGRTNELLPNYFSSFFSDFSDNFLLYFENIMFYRIWTVLGGVALCERPIGWLLRRGEYIQVNCNRWDCPDCGPIKRNKLADRVKNLFADTYLGSGKVRCITLTQRQGSIRNIMEDWDYLIKRLRRNGYDIRKYFWVKEFTKKGQRHLHILVDVQKDIPKDELTEHWRYITDGESFITWINEAEVQNAAGYVMKYLTKAFMEETGFEKKERRYGFCRRKHSREYVDEILASILPYCRGVFELDYEPGQYMKLAEKEQMFKRYYDKIKRRENEVC